MRTGQYNQNTPATERSCNPWLKRLGLFGFLFFLIKGLLWLIIPGWLVILGINS